MPCDCSQGVHYGHDGPVVVDDEVRGGVPATWAAVHVREPHERPAGVDPSGVVVYPPDGVPGGPRRAMPAGREVLDVEIRTDAGLDVLCAYADKLLGQGYCSRLVELVPGEKVSEPGFQVAIGYPEEPVCHGKHLVNLECFSAANADGEVGFVCGTDVVSTRLFPTSAFGDVLPQA